MYCLHEIFICLILSLIYVVSLYIWNAPQERYHPSTIKKRATSVFCVSLLTPLYVKYTINEEILTKATIWEIVGVRIEGIVSAIVLPYILIAVLYLGPLYQNHQSIPIANTLLIYADPRYWINTMQNPIWWRNQVVAPFTEELTFRSGMMPILLQCISPGKAIFICSLFFGVAHLHHAILDIRSGKSLFHVMIKAFVQMLYTTLFGIYTSFLFVRTGHFISLFIAHSFCNHMGLPELFEVYNKPEPQRSILFLVHIIGLVAWIFLLYPLTSPELYSNTLYSL